MANDITGNPFVIDTVTDSITPTGTFHEVYAVVWASGSLADVVSLQNQAGNVKFSTSGTVANAHTEFTVPTDRPILFNGMKCPSLTSGKLYVYQKQRNTL